jgi:hypothetical protein
MGLPGSSRVLDRRSVAGSIAQCAQGSSALSRFSQESRSASGASVRLFRLTRICRGSGWTWHRVIELSGAGKEVLTNNRAYFALDITRVTWRRLEQAGTLLLGIATEDYHRLKPPRPGAKNRARRQSVLVNHGAPRPAAATRTTSLRRPRPRADGRGAQIPQVDTTAGRRNRMDGGTRGSGRNCPRQRQRGSHSAVRSEGTTSPSGPTGQIELIA